MFWWRENIKNALSKILKIAPIKIVRLKMRNSVNNWNSLLDQRKVKKIMLKICFKLKKVNLMRQ